MSIIDKKKLMFANMMLSGGLPMFAELVTESAPFRRAKKLRIDVLAYRVEMRAKSEAIQKEANEKIDAAQREANQRYDALQAEFDKRIDDLVQSFEDLFSDAGLEDLFEALKEPEPAPAPPVGPAVVKPSSVHVLRSGDPPASE